MTQCGDRPDFPGRLQILRLHADKVRLATDVDLEAIVARTPGRVGSDLANVINEAALLAARYGKTDVTMDELDEAIDRILAGPQKKSRVMAQQEKKRVAYHESGYALVAQEAAHRVAGVHDVVNAIEVKTLSSEARSDIDPAQMARHVMEWDVLVPDEGITLTVDKGWITLEGTVKAWAQRNKAERTLQHLAGV